MNVPRDDLTPTRRPVQEGHVNVLFLFTTHAPVLRTHKARDRITETLEEVARVCHKLVNDPSLQAVVVIEGFSYAQLYSAATFRWLCGIGPDPSGKDPNWMGGKL